MVTESAQGRVSHPEAFSGSADELRAHLTGVQHGYTPTTVDEINLALAHHRLHEAPDSAAL